MKAITAINAIIILVLGVLTLLAILGLFLGVWNPAKGGTSLQAATQSICKTINPVYCHPKSFNDCWIIERLPVMDFDANKNGVVNEHVISVENGITLPTRWKDDNFLNLCYNFYGGPERIDQTDQQKEQFISVCLVKVCGCPRYADTTCA